MIKNITLLIQLVVRSLTDLVTNVSIKIMKANMRSLPQSSNTIYLIFVNILDKTSKLESISLFCSPPVYIYIYIYITVIEDKKNF